MKMGFSGARITRAWHEGERVAVKQCKNASAQASVCRFLYPVTPFVNIVGKGNYCMEWLTEPHPTIEWCEKSFIEALRVLNRMVWPLAAIFPEEIAGQNWSQGWRSALIDFCGQRGYGVGHLIGKYFPDEFLAECHQMIHGDPTICNLMYRGREMVLIDPIPLSPKIAPHRSVDVGKLLQSAIGWEILRFGWHYNRKMCIKDIFDFLGMDEFAQNQCWFWCAIHLLRIVPYDVGNGEVTVWCKDWALKIFKAIEDDECSTRLISTAL